MNKHAIIALIIGLVAVVIVVIVIVVVVYFIRKHNNNEEEEEEVEEVEEEEEVDDRPEIVEYENLGKLNTHTKTFTFTNVPSSYNTFNSTISENQISPSDVNKVQYDITSVSNESSSTSLKGYYDSASYVEEIDFGNFNAEYITDISGCFSNCTSLAAVMFNSSFTEISDASYLFTDCISLVATYMPSGTFSSTLNLSYMFNNCNSLSEIALANDFGTGATDTSYMFNGCTNLKNIIFGQSTFESLTNAKGMFTDCSNVELIDIRYFTPPSDIDVSGIFNGINSGNWILYIKAAFLKTILKNTELNTDYTIDAKDDTVLELTCEGTNITEIVSTEEPETTTEYDISEEGILTFNSNATQNTLLTPISALTDAYEAITEIDYSNISSGMFSTTDDNETLSFGGLYSGCKALTSIYFGDKFDTSHVSIMGNMFRNCESLTSLNISGFDFSKVEDMSYMFYGCTALESITFPEDINTSNVSTMGSLFYNCSSLTELNLSAFDTSNVSVMSYMFYGCSSLSSIELGDDFTTDKVNSIIYMFNGCSSLSSIEFPVNFTIQGVYSTIHMFGECSSLTGLDLSNFNTKNNETMNSMFINCESLASITFGKDFDTSNVSNMVSTFSGCSSLTTLNLDGFNTKKCQAMRSMFEGCTHLEDLYLTNFEYYYREAFPADRTLNASDMLNDVGEENENGGYWNLYGTYSFINYLLTKKVLQDTNSILSGYNNSSYTLKITCYGSEIYSVVDAASE